MKGARRLFAGLCVVFVSSFANAQMPTEITEGELLSPGSMKGLCTTDSEKSMFFENYCKSIQEQLAKPCTQDLIKGLRAQLLSQDPQGRYFSVSIKDCRHHEESIKKDQKNFENIILQFMATLAIAESKHREYAGLVNDKMADNSGKKGGLFNLSDEILKDEKYKCGCENINSTGEGKDLTVNDAHLQATCATYVALYWANKHGRLYGGDRKSGSKNCQPGSTRDNLDYSEPMGAACIFKSLQEIPRAPGQPPRKPTDLADAPELNRIELKMKNYCDKSIRPNGSIDDGRMYRGADTGEVRSTR